MRLFSVSDCKDTYASPCGACRQVLSEFSGDGSLQVVMARPDGHYKVRLSVCYLAVIILYYYGLQIMSISDLLPSAFSRSELEEVDGGQGT